jgi:hypothetical protein
MARLRIDDVDRQRLRGKSANFFNAVHRRDYQPTMARLPDGHSLTSPTGRDFFDFRGV